MRHGARPGGTRGGGQPGPDPPGTPGLTRLRQSPLLGVGTALEGRGRKEATREKLSGGKGTGSSPLRKRTEGTADEPPRLRSPRLSFSGRPAPPTAGRGSSRGWRAPGDGRGRETATAGSTLPAALTGPDAPWAPQGQASGRVAGGAETRASAHGHVGRGGGLHGADSGGAPWAGPAWPASRFHWDLRCLACSKHSLPAASVGNGFSRYSVRLSLYFSSEPSHR